MSIVSLNCPVCKNYTFDTFKNVFDDRFGEPNQYKLAKCTSCNHISTFPRLKQQDLGKLYEKYYPRKYINHEQIFKKAKKDFSPFSNFLYWFKGINNQGHFYSKKGEMVLDIGCGNGYFGWRMLEAGAQKVVGLDPMVLFCVQYFALNRYLQSDRHWVLPLRFEQVRPELTQERFDSVFSMGVLYHQRNPQQHIQDIKNCLKPEGQLVLETLIVEGDKSLDLEGRYAKMRNVWNVPCPDELTQWVSDSGFSDVEILDINRTTFEEQNRTEWMTFGSLPNYLDPDDPNKTIEGYPAPTRCLVRAVKK